MNSDLKRKPALLFLGGGTRVTHVELFQKYFSVMITDMDPLAPATVVADESILTGAFNDTDFGNQLMQFVRDRKIDVVAPASHHSLEMLSRQKQALADVGVFPLVSETSAVDISLDKKKSNDFFRRIGVSAPKIFPAGEEQLPVFIKPQDGCGGKNCFIAKTDYELDFFRHYVPKAFIQEFIEGTEYTVDTFSDFDGKPVCIVPRKRIEVRDGEVVKGVTVKDSKLIAQARQIIEGLGLIGINCIQCIERNGDFYFTEINCRFGGGITLSIGAGADFPLYLLKAIQSEALKYEENWSEGVFMARAYRDFFYNR